jgi:hypothetical protein
MLDTLAKLPPSQTMFLVGVAVAFTAYPLVLAYAYFMSGRSDGNGRGR